VLSRGVRPLNRATFDVMRVWAALTGVALAVWYFVALYLGFAQSETLPMLVAGIGGFEMVLYGQDLMRRRRHG
jgi:zinc transporter ZupT